MAKQQLKYVTEKDEPKCVHYFERHFVHLSFWFDWLLLKANMYRNIPYLRKELECSEPIAKKVIWNAYIAASTGDEDSPVMDAFEGLLHQIPPEELPLYLAHTTIGSNINDGVSEKKSIKEYKEWLQEDPENPIFGNYILLEDFSVVPVPKKPKKPQKKADRTPKKSTSKTSTPKTSTKAQKDTPTRKTKAEPKKPTPKKKK